MIAAYISLFFSVLCLVVLLIILIRLKKITSQENLLKKIDIYLNKRVKELDSIAYRDSEIVKTSSKTIRDLISQSEEMMEKYKEATDRLRNMIAETEKLSKKVDKNTELKLDEDIVINISDTKKIVAEENRINVNDTYSFSRPVIINKNSADSVATNEFITLEKNKKNDFATKVIKMYDRGYSVETIAEQLSCSVTEVQYVIDLEL